MKDKKPSKKSRFTKMIPTISIVISLILSTIALYNTTDDIESVNGRDAYQSMTKMGPIYGTHSCEKGGFSIQIGLDLDGDNVLDNSEVEEIRNVCHGPQGESGPMGNRGYWGYNGTNGLNGTDGVDGSIGISSFIQSHLGFYGPCPDAVVIEMGNNSSSQKVDSQIKICFQNLTSGRLSDIQPNSGNSFSTACNGGFSNDNLFVFAAVEADKCLLYKMDNNTVQQISPTVDFSPGKNVGFTEHQNRIWFDAEDGTGVQLWSTDGHSIWKETNLSGGINAGDEILKHGEELILNHQAGLGIFGESEAWTDGLFSNITSVNGVLIFNTGSSISINGALFNAEINSVATFADGYYWFIATSDSLGPQLHRSDGTSLEQMTTTLLGTSGTNITPSIIGERIVFDSGGLMAFIPSNSSLVELNSTIQEVGENTGMVAHNGLFWFDCGIPAYGYELCVTDGISAWLHTDYANGMESSHPTHLSIVGDNLLTLVDDPIEGGELHLVTSSGLELLWDHAQGDLESGNHGQMWITKDMVYFIADSATYGLEMYGWSHGELDNEWIILS
jgi:hypothetical protein